MSQVKMLVCDQCRKETNNEMNTPGWIVIAGELSYPVKITVRRAQLNGDSGAQSEYQSERFDFCSTKCLMDYFVLN